MANKGENILLFQFLFMKGMAFIYLAAFYSVFQEISPLLGVDGLLPVHTFFKRVKANGINYDMSKIPTLFWWSPEIHSYITQIIPSLKDYESYDTCLHIFCLIGMFLSLMAIVSSKFINFFTYFILWFIYLSILNVGSVFFQFQWDIMLLEAGFLAMFFTPCYKQGQLIVDELSSVIRDLLKWLSFRLNYASGVVKLTSKCPTWWGLTALNYHFESQPLPNPISWYFHHLPEWLKKLFVAQNFVTLIGGSLMMFVPYRRFRIFGALMVMSEQFMIILTGNYNFFNFLTTLVTLAATDDEFLRFCIPQFILKMLGDFPQEEQKKVENSKKRQSNNDKDKKKNEDDDGFNKLISALRLFIQFLIFLGLVIWCYMTFFPLDKNTKHVKVNFSYYDIIVYLVNGYIPIIAMLLAMLYAAHNLFHYSIQYNHIPQLLPVRNIKRLFALVFGFLMFMLSSSSFFAGLDKEAHEFPLNIPTLTQLSNLIHPFHITNSYGLFRRMTGVNGREELIFEVSQDGIKYEEISFFYKPGPISKPLEFVAPYHPRLDWQLWFSAMKNHVNDAYLINMLYKLINNKPSILSLVEHNPLEGKDIKFLNVRKYIYTFTTPEEKQETGNYWKRQKRELLLERVMRGHNNLEDNLLLMKFELDTKQHPLHILRDIPVLSIIITVLLIVLIKNLIVKTKKQIKKE